MVMFGEGPIWIVIWGTTVIAASTYLFCVVFALLAICVGNSPIPGEFPAQRPVTRSFDVFNVCVKPLCACSYNAVKWALSFQKQESSAWLSNYIQEDTAGCNYLAIP